MKLVTHCHGNLQYKDGRQDFASNDLNLQTSNIPPCQEPSPYSLYFCQSFTSDRISKMVIEVIYLHILKSDNPLGHFHTRWKIDVSSP